MSNNTYLTNANTNSNSYINTNAASNNFINNKNYERPLYYTPLRSTKSYLKNSNDYVHTFLIILGD